MKNVFFLSCFLFIAHSFAQKTNNNSLFKDYLEKGFKYHDNRKLDSSRYFLNKIDSLIKLHPKDSSSFYQKELLEASLFVRENKMDDAIKKLLRANHFFKEKKDSANIGLSLYKLGVANYYVNRRLKAGEYFDEVIPYKKFVSKRLLTRIHQNYGTINLEVGLLSKPKNRTLIFKAIKSYEEAIKIYKEENWLMEHALATSLLAECYNQLEDFDTALHLINKAILIARKAKNKSQEGFALIKKTTILGQKKKYKEALKTIQIAKPIFIKLKDKPTYLYSLNEEKKILFGLGKFKDASILSDTIYKVAIKNYDTRFVDKVSEMEVKYKTTEKEKEIAQQKEQLLTKELEIKNRNLYAILLVAALLILGIISFSFYKRNQLKRKQLQKEIDLKDALSTIKTQNRLQEQRLRISRDLHDNIGSQLTFIISSIDNLKYISKDASDKLKEKLSNISSFTGDTIHQLRDTIWAMNKNEVSVEDLHARVLSYVEKAKTVRPDINFKVNYSIDKNLSLTSFAGMNIFRVLQEAINNAIKYANATSIDINLNKKDNHFIAAVIDNGIGFNITKVELGNGLSNMEKRMSKIGGKVVINSNEEIGTDITLKLNIENTAYDV
ncbi:signal transduction histidine kinase [Lutibacter sp. Hel_I_33_5]|uniref:tetratricopeptide repeat-containing sensor histidine kinase n=1 Tax=Lutibacter sp. Hel_I_33_5 TaxID=1566289 RepID=UPI0011A1F815|nr:sensor histidine kinase [Lutibacter sp. Hel_I_33_5]TVZ56032.1 signal transduction histidine kinase [Lutibacter sp. Hel_I_33_5]